MLGMKTYTRDYIDACRARVDVTPDITEDWKWDTGVWVHGGMVCADEAAPAGTRWCRICPVG